MGIKVVYLSVNSTVAQSYHASALDAEAEKLWFSGVTVVVAAGNGTGNVQFAPANDPFVITVGSIDDNYQTSLAASPMASWALYGKTQDGFNKPELVADGSHVVSLLAPGSALSVSHTGNVVGTSYFKMGGTSMAAPQVAGMVALMLQNQPRLGNWQMREMLRRHTSGFGTTRYTSWLGLDRGFLDSSSIRGLDREDSTGLYPSQSFDTSTGNVLAGGIWWTGADWSNVAWNNVAWNNIAWNAATWSNVAWNTTSGSPSTNPSSWANVAWNNVAWNETAWSNVAWNNVAWNNVAWNNVAWNNVAWNNIAWNNVAWNGGIWL
jgi:serine protease AprX